MLGKLIVTFGLIFIVLLGGILVDRLYARFKRGNPNLGPFRDKEKCGCCAAKEACNDRSSCDV